MVVLGATLATSACGSSDGGIVGQDDPQDDAALICSIPTEKIIATGVQRDGILRSPIRPWCPWTGRERRIFAMVIAS